MKYQNKYIIECVNGHKMQGTIGIPIEDSKFKDEDINKCPLCKGDLIPSKCKKEKVKS